MNANFRIPKILLACAILISWIHAARAQSGYIFPLSQQNTQAQHSVQLVKNGKYEDARQLLEKLKDEDFVLPPRREVVSFQNGQAAVAAEPSPPIGNRKLLLAECLMHLDKTGDAMDLVWELLKAGRSDNDLYQVLLQGVTNSGYANVTKQLKTLLAAKPQSHPLQLADQYITVANALSSGDYGTAVAAIQTSTYLRQSGWQPERAFKEWVSTQLSSMPEKSVPLLIAQLEKQESPSPAWIIYCLGLCKDPAAIGPLEKSRKALNNYWMSREIDAALEQIRSAGKNGPGKTN